jgi:hypothetical protein
VCLVSVPALHAEEPKKGKVVRETWDAAYADGIKVGYFHTLVREVEDDTGKYLRTTVDMELDIRRGKATVKLRAATGDDETLEGKVTAVTLVQPQGKGQQLEIRGKVVDKQLHITVNDPPSKKQIPWNDEVVGLSRQDGIFREKKVKPGDSFKYLSFEPTITSIVPIAAAVKDDEEVEVMKVGKDGKISFATEKLLRADAVPDKVEGLSFRLPALALWLDKDLNVVRSETELPGICKLVLHRTTKEIATSENGIAPNILRPIALNRAITQPHDTRSVVYRVTLKGDEDPKTAFADDAHQSIKNVKGDSFEVHVHPVVAPKDIKEPGAAAEKFLKSNAFIDSDDDMVKKRARAALQGETDPWKKAQKIESWVHEHMTAKNDVLFCKASKVAESLEGDCRQYAMLTAAMCRAADVPSRSAVGLVYMLDETRHPGMAFHMWTEVWIKGQWIPLDATLGRGHVGGGHLKVADDSWSDTQSLTPMLPVTRILGKITLEVVSVNDGEK